MVECEMCGFEITVEKNAAVGELVACGQCGQEFEITGVNPLKLSKAPETEEDFGE
ncbi:lysine biosynthesis protein LysW [Candidatus Woesearchaeota archaeon]|nr:lysine biosynthesis protein LysW [Candidatus Woesearchaeota archaeon]